MIDPQMNAVRLHALGDPASLTYERLPTPRPGPGEVLVRVHAAAITRDELEWPEGRLPATPSYEFSGVVAETGPAVARVRPGSEVYGLCAFDGDGAAADYVLVPETAPVAKPHTLDHVHSAALPLPGLTAWQGLFDHGRLEAGQRVLIHGGGGVGALAIQLARSRGAHVIATTSTAKLDAVRELGAHEAIDHTAERFEERLEPVELVFDTAGGERLERSAAVLTRGGRLVSIATEPPPVSRPDITALYFVVEPNPAQLAELTGLADAGRLRVPVDGIYPLAEARAAFERGREGGGKLVLSPLVASVRLGG